MISRAQLTTGVDKSVYWFIIALPFFVSFSSAAVNLLIALLLVAAIVKAVLDPASRDFRTPLTIPFVLLILFAILSFINTISMKASIQGIEKLLKYLVLVSIVAVGIKGRCHLRKVLIAAMLGVTLASLDGIYQLIFGVDLIRGHAYDSMINMIRINATFPQTNVFAGYLALVLPILVPLILYSLKGRERLIALLIAMIGFYALTFTFCRSAGAGVLLALVVMGIIKKDKVVLLILVGTLLAGVLFAPANIRQWAKNAKSVAELCLGRDRPIVFETAFQMIKKHPVLGVGVNTFSENYQQYKLRDAVYDVGNENAHNAKWYAHNSFLHMAAETGLFYLLTFLAMLGILFRQWAGFYKKAEESFLKYASLGVVMSLIAFLVHGLTETNLYYPKIAVLFWFQVGILIAMVRVGGTAPGTCKHKAKA